MADPLSSWHDGAAKEAILGFVHQTCADGAPGPVPVDERVAVFDNDGTLWCEKPMPIQLDFILRRLSEMAEADPTLRDRQPWKAAHERDHGWLARVMAEHYAGDDTNVTTLGAGVVAAYANITVDQFEADAATFLRNTRHPTLDRGYLECAYAPMVELLAFLRANGFTNYIASGGGRDFMRPISQEVYGIPRDGVIGSAVALAYSPGELGGVRSPARPPRTTSMTGRRSRCTSGPAPDDDPCSPPATPTATSRCSTSPSTGTSPSSGSSCSMTTPTASSTTCPARSKRSSAREPAGGRW